MDPGMEEDDLECQLVAHEQEDRELQMELEAHEQAQAEAEAHAQAEAEAQAQAQANLDSLEGQVSSLQREVRDLQEKFVLQATHKIQMETEVVFLRGQVATLHTAIIRGVAAVHATVHRPITTTAATSPATTPAEASGSARQAVSTVPAVSGSGDQWPVAGFAP